MKSQESASTAPVGINFRMHRYLYDDMIIITERTKSSSAAFISHAVEYYINAIKKCKMDDTKLKIDRFAYELTKN